MYGRIDPNDNEACPHCGWVNPDLWEFRDGSTEAECPECGRPIIVNVVTDRTVTIQKQ